MKTIYKVVKTFNLLFVFTNNYKIVAGTGVILLTVRAQTPYPRTRDLLVS